MDRKLNLNLYSQGNWYYCQVSLDIRIASVMLQTVGLNPLYFIARPSDPHTQPRVKWTWHSRTLRIMEIKKRGLGCAIPEMYKNPPSLLQGRNSGGSYASLHFLSVWFEPELRFLSVWRVTCSTCGFPSTFQQHNCFWISSTVDPLPFGNDDSSLICSTASILVRVT